MLDTETNPASLEMKAGDFIQFLKNAKTTRFKGISPEFDRARVYTHADCVTLTSHNGWGGYSQYLSEATSKDPLTELDVNFSPMDTLKLISKAKKSESICISDVPEKLVIKTKEFTVSDTKQPCEWELAGFKNGKRVGSFKINAKKLLRAVQSVERAVCHEETRYYLNGIFLEDKNDGIVVTATNGHFLIQRALAFTSKVGKLAPAGARNCGVIIPKQMLPALVNLLENETDDSEINVVTHDAKIVFYGDTGDVWMSLIEGTYPDYARVIPGKNAKPIFKANRTAFLDKFKVLSISVRTLEWDYAGGPEMILRQKIVMGDRAKDGPVIETPLKVTPINKSDFFPAYRSSYVESVVRSFGEEVLTIRGSDEGSPVLITGEEEGALAVLMPKRRNS